MGLREWLDRQVALGQADRAREASQDAHDLIARNANWLEERIQSAKAELRQLAQTGTAEQLDERLEQLCQFLPLYGSTYAQGVLSLLVRQLKEQKAAGAGGSSGA